LAHACTLSGGNEGRILNFLNVDSLPWMLEGIVDIIVESFDGRRVFLVGVLNATENINELVIEVATGVVVPALIDAR